METEAKKQNSYDRKPHTGHTVKESVVLPPPLRFAGCTAPWQTVPLAALAEKVREKNRAALPLAVYTNSAEQGIIPRDDFFERDVANREHLTRYYVVRENDFVYNPRISAAAPVGPLSRSKQRETGIMSPLYCVFRPHGADAGFLEAYFKSAHWHSYMRQNATGGARADRLDIRDDAFFAMPICLPQSREEQVQTAALFAALERTIDGIEAACGQLKQLESIFMQKLFPPRDKAEPALRMKDCTGAWQWYRLGDIGTVYSGLTGKKKEDFGCGRDRFITYTNVFENPLAQKDGTEAVTAGAGQTAVRRGDVLFTAASETVQEAGMASVWDYDEPHVYVNSFCFGFRPKIELDAAFLAYLLRSPCFRSQLTVLAQGISRYNLSKSRVTECFVPLPPLAEQKAVGACFTALAQLSAQKTAYAKAVSTVKQILLEKMLR